VLVAPTFPTLTRSRTAIFCRTARSGAVTDCIGAPPFNDLDRPGSWRALRDRRAARAPRAGWPQRPSSRVRVRMSLFSAARSASMPSTTTLCSSGPSAPRSASVRRRHCCRSRGNARAWAQTVRSCRPNASAVTVSSVDVIGAAWRLGVARELFHPCGCGIQHGRTAAQ